MPPAETTHVDTRVGRNVTLVLPDHARDGWRWEIASIVPGRGSMVAMVRRDRVRDPHAKWGDATTGATHFTFRAVNEGDVTISLRFRQPRTGLVSREHVFTVSIAARELEDRGPARVVA